jgi:hypothetical protein
VRVVADEAMPAEHLTAHSRLLAALDIGMGASVRLTPLGLPLPPAEVWPILMH